MDTDMAMVIPAMDTVMLTSRRLCGCLSIIQAAEHFISNPVQLSWSSYAPMIVSVLVLFRFYIQANSNCMFTFFIGYNLAITAAYKLQLNLRAC